MFEDMLFQTNISDGNDFMPLFTLDEEMDLNSKESYPNNLPLLPLKNTVLFPGVVIPITIGRDKSIKAITKAYEGEKIIGVLSQKDSNVEDPKTEDLYRVGTLAKILKLLRMPDGTITAILQGKKRFELLEFTNNDPIMEGNITTLEYEPVNNSLEFEAMISSIRDHAKQIIELSPQIPTEAVVMLKNITNDVFLVNFIASNLNTKPEQKQILLQYNNLSEFSSQLLTLMNSELQMLELKDQIDSKVRTDLERQQKDYFLNMQLKTIQEELGQGSNESEIANILAKAEKKKWPQAVKSTFDKEIQKLRRTNPQAPDYSVTMNYIDWLIELPWSEYTKDNFDLKKVKEALDKDHYGLEDVKQRIIEHLAVLKLKGDMKAPILCLVGPPGVGKTSLGKSIAGSIKRNFVRMSLGGLHDEAEIRGHRKTYIGALPGRIIQSLKKAGSSNPVFILDEIDKIGKDFRGDPSSALLEVLDPEQNSTFYDNFLELEYDLSKVMFIATANSLSSIQPALLDRMEIIEVSGYSLEEKREIAKRHLIPEQRKEHGLKPKDVKLTDEIIAKIISEYTRESGVRSLDRKLAGVMRQVAKRVALSEKYNPNLAPPDIETMLGHPRFTNDLYEENKTPGVAVGLAWTQVGGDVLYIESSLSKGKGKLTLTGNLGEVMKESAYTALSYLKSHSQWIGLDPDVFDQKDIHVHVPEGAIPKDGPSAGITMLTSLASAFTGRAVKSRTAMTGEITLRGKVLPVGGIKEKVLAAKRFGVKNVILCIENKKDINEINPTYLEHLNFTYVSRMEEVLQATLGIDLIKAGPNLK